MENTNDSKDNIFEINSKKHFSLSEANELIKVISKITFKHQSELSFLTEQIEIEIDPNVSAQLKIAAQKIVDKWNQKIEMLGGRPKGIWFVDLDFGSGYYCWKYPEKELIHWHKYDEGFTKRKKLVHIHLQEQV